MGWTVEQRIRVLANMGDDLSIHEWATIMDCDVTDIWRCAAIAAAGNARAASTLSPPSPGGAPDGSEGPPRAAGQHTYQETNP